MVTNPINVTSLLLPLALETERVVAIDINVFHVNGYSQYRITSDKRSNIHCIITMCLQNRRLEPVMNTVIDMNRG